eukprot:Rhum_TRINITY_DN3343_c0_g1::Rhum_TRINITY_DN3343_c0_g1_i1::g.10629::m.10629
MFSRHEMLVFFLGPNGNTSPLLHLLGFLLPLRLPPFSHTPHAWVRLLVTLATQELGKVALRLQLLLVLVDEANGEEDTRARADRTQEVGQNRQDTDAHATEGGGRRDVALEVGLQLLLGGRLADQHKLLRGPLGGHVLRGLLRDADPHLGEQGAHRADEQDVEQHVHGVLQQVGERVRRRHVVRKSADRHRLSVSVAGVARGLPLTEQVHEQVGREAGVEHLRDEVQVGHEGRLQDDRGVARVEQLDRLRGRRLRARVLQGDPDGEALEEDHDNEDQERGEQVHDVGQVGTVESVLQRAHLVVVLEDLLEQQHDGTLELRAAAGVQRERREGLPDDGLADGRGHEQRDTRADSVALLEQLVQEDADDTGNHELGNDQEGDEDADVGNVTVHARHHVRHGLNERDDQTEQLLRARKQPPVTRVLLVHRDQLGSLQQLHDHRGGHNRGDTELHQGALVGGEDHTHPVEGVGARLRADSEDGDLAADEEDEESKARPCQPRLRGLLLPGLVHFGKQAQHGLHEVKNTGHCFVLA